MFRHSDAYITNMKITVGSVRAPVVADFSSLGPNTVNPEIIKVDIPISNICTFYIYIYTFYMFFITY